MAYHINDQECINCGTCASDCPVECIAEGETEEYYVIDESQCIDCGTCAGVCPTQCISPED